MDTIEYRTIDKSTWPRGQWDDEPDKIQWQDETGLPCLAVRNKNHGNWCGYVGVTKDHPLYGKHHEESELDAHGGMTFAGGCDPGRPEDHGICHVGEPDDVWWFGFDCAHYLDYLPALDAQIKHLLGRPSALTSGVYRDLDYVMRECASLAQQLACAVDSSPSTRDASGGTS